MAKISEKMADLLSKQSTHELLNHVKYQQAANWFRRQNLNGFAKFCASQADGELVHARKFMDYIADRDGNALIGVVEQPKQSFMNPLDIFEFIFSVELDTTKRIEDLITEAREMDDDMTFELLQWFIKEQVEEENTIQEIVVKLRMIKQDGTGILLLDQHLLS